MIFELPIKDTYVPGWGTWECIRETMQNGLDQGDLGFALKVSYKDGWLSVYNLGADMSVKSLLIGHTDKADNKDMRGQYGEGLDLSFLAGVRSGYEMKVFTQTESWVPTLEHSDKYGAKVLFVRTRKLQTQRAGVEVRIKMPEDDWGGFQRLFVSMRDIDDSDFVHTDMGTIFFDEESSGMIYVKGIFVEKREDFRYGYDLKDANLDRDRKVVGDFHLKWEISRMYSEASHRRPEIVKNKVYVMLKGGTKDVEGFSDYTTSKEMRDQIAAQFLAEHGSESVPVKSIGESAEMEHYGKAGVVVNDNLKKVLENSQVDTPDKLKQKLANEMVNKFSWQELTEDEQAVLKGTCDLIDNVFAMIHGDEDTCKKLHISMLWSRINWKLLDRVNIAQFRDEDIRGISSRDTQEIQLARKTLESHAMALRTCIHEIPHMVLGCHDGSGGHNVGLEELWSLVYFSRQ